MTTTDQSQDLDSGPTLHDWLTLLQTNHDESINEQVKNIDAAEAAILARQQAAIAKAVAEARLDEFQKVANAVELGKPRSKYVRQVYLKLSYLKGRLAELKATVTTLKERKE